MSKIDNIFIKVVSDEDICRNYKIDRPEQYRNVAMGMRAANPYVVAIATALSSLDKNVEAQKADMRLRHQTGPVVIKDTDMKSIYKKLITILEKAR